MAKETTKKTTTRKPKAAAQTAEYRGQMFQILEANENAVCLTDGTIHFWVRKKDVTLG